MMKARHRIIINILSFIIILHSILVAMFILLARMKFKHFPMQWESPSSKEMPFYFLKQIDYIIAPLEIIFLPIFIVYMLYIKLIYKNKFNISVFCLVNILILILLYFVFDMLLRDTILWYLE